MALTITWLGHATVVLDLDGTRVVTDPLLRPHNGPLRRRGPAPRQEQWHDADAVLISHLHHDHAELPSLRGYEGPVLTAEENAAFLRRRHVHGGVGLGEEWYDVEGSSVQVRLTKAIHGARPMPHRPNAANGHLVRTPDLRVWVAGDTELFDGMAEIPELAGGPIDLAVVPVGGWGARLSAGHLDAGRAAQACALVGAAVAMPYHWGTLYAPGTSTVPRGWMDAPGKAFPGRLAEHAPECKPLVLRPGESATL